MHSHDRKHHFHQAQTFEAGASLMQSRVKRGDPLAYLANSADPLHAAFAAKAAIHTGLSGSVLMGEAALAKMKTLAGVSRTGKTLAYFHIPFCETRCLYCLFYQNPLQSESSAHYVDSLIAEMQLWANAPLQQGRVVHAVYLGGGTPTALQASDLSRLLKAIKQYLPLANDCEITLEGRIHHFSEEKIEAALKGGVNRFSLGVQSFNTKVRQAMMRVDDRENVIALLEKLGSYDNAAVVIDLIYGFPFQTMDIWEDDMKTAASLPLDGVDCYQLNVFEKSPLAKYVANGKYPPVSDTAEKADMFARSVEFFTKQQWKRLTNNHWARTCRERNIYNAFGKGPCDCLAYGSGAGGRIAGHSFMMDRTLASWEKSIKAGIKPVGVVTEPMDNWFVSKTVASEMESGAINLFAIGKRFGIPLENTLSDITEQWCEAGLLKKEGEWLIQTVAGQFWHVTMAQLLVDALQKRLLATEDSHS